MSHDGKSLAALYARDNLDNNGNTSSSTSNRKRSRFDEGGPGEELGRDSREANTHSSGYRERINESSDNKERRNERREDERGREYGRDYRDREYKERNTRDSSRDYELSENKRNRTDRNDKTDREYRSDRDYDRERELDRGRHYSREDDRGYDRNKHYDRDHRDRYSSRSDRRSDSRSIEIPFDRFLRLSPWRGQAIPLEERPRHLKNWDSAPAGFERISADKAKLTGLFPPPGNITKTSNYIPPTLDPARAAMFQLLNKDGVPMMSNNSSSVNTGGTDVSTGNIPANLLKQAKRFYVGNLPMDFNEQSLLKFLETNLRSLSGGASNNGNNKLDEGYSHLNTLENRVLNITVSSDRSYAFVECRSPEDASMAMNLDGVIFDGSQLKVRRPKEYHIAVTSGVLKPNATSSGSEQLTRASSINSTNNSFAPISESAKQNALTNRSQLIISGIPEILTSDHIKSLLLMVTDLRTFLFLKDRETDKSLGVAVFEFVEEVNIEGVGEWSGPFLKHSNGILFMGPFEMKIQRVCDVAETESESNDLRNILSVYNLQPGYATAPSSTPILQLLNIVTRESLLTDYETIFNDLKQELIKYQTDPASSDFELIIPKPEKDSSIMVPGVGKVFVKFGRIEDAAKTASDLAGRIFDGHTCIVSFYPLEKFEKRIF